MKTKLKVERAVENIDSLAVNIFRSLRSDFSHLLECPSFQSASEYALLKGISSFRDYKFPKDWYAEPVTYLKARIQLRDLFKKYRFRKDRYSDSELEKLSLDKYVAHQKYLRTVDLTHPLAQKVLIEAARIVKEVLGDYSPDKTVELARFGTKSSVGCPLALAYLDNKLSDTRAFTSSSRCANWFFYECLESDTIMKELVEKLQSDGWTLDQFAHESLNLVFVPKSWKALRIITPLTLLSLFYSFGLGEQITRSLVSVGINLSRQQSLHRKLIQNFSVNLSHVTADLSSASDSITDALLLQLLPADWYQPITRCLTSRYTYKGQTVESLSVAPMGNGLTFPLQTLVFYSITRAIGNLCGSRGLVSVYGDDLIYPRRVHRYVRVIFPLLGFILNEEKTFSDVPFRESCGSDYYKGVDVRPAHLPNWEGGRSQTQYLAWLYKAANGLLARWEYSHIPRTISLLMDEVVRIAGEVFLIPPSFPETAGLRVSDPAHGLPFHPVAPVHFRDSGTVAPACWIDSKQRVAQGYSFKYLSATTRKRFVKTQLPFYWDCLRRGYLRQRQELDHGRPWHHYLFPDDSPETITLVKQRSKRSYTCNKTGKYIVKKVTRLSYCVATHQTPLYSYKVYPDNPGNPQTQISIWA